MIINHRDCECYNVFVSLSSNAYRKINKMMNSHSKITLNDKIDALLRQSNFDGLFFMLDSNEKKNRILFLFWKG